MSKKLQPAKSKAVNKIEKIGKIETITKSKKSTPGDGSFACGVKGGNW